MKRMIVLIFLMVIQFTMDGQFNPEDFKAMKFRNIGPAGMSGRVTAIDVDLSNEDRIFAGAASGGLWLSVNGGISWKPIFDDQSTLSIGAIEINQSNPAEVWVGTGEGNPRNSVNVGGGLYKSIDGGKTWKLMGLKATKVIHRIIVHKDNPDVVYVAATGSPWGPHPERGVYRTTDGGKTWDKILFVNNLTGPADMVVDPSNPNKIIVGMWQHQRTPWDFTSGGEGSGMYLTYDGGDNWKRLEEEDGMPKGDLGRIGLAFAPSKPNIVYALIEAKENGLYKSIDGGASWSLVSKKNIGNRPFYYSEIYVDPGNENRIFNIYTYISLSEDGGKTFRQIADYGNAVHPDHHAFWISPSDPSFLLNGNDGGMNISRDGGMTWEFVDNLPVGQFYHVGIDNEFPYNVYGGMQDNGSWGGPAYVLRSGSIRNSDWQELMFGDGFDVSPLPSDSRYGYAMSQGGNVGLYDKVTGRTQFVKPTHPDHKPLRYNWNAALAQDPFNDCGVYFGSQYVHYSTDCGKSWQIISPDLTTNDTTKQKQAISGGLTIDATNAENHTTLLAIAPSPVTEGVIWASSDDGNLQITQDGGQSWNNVASRLPGLPSGSWIPQIEVSHDNAAEAWVVANNYRRNDFKPYTYHTSNYGQSWTRVADDSQVDHFVCSIVQDDHSPNLVFLGTDGGLYISFDKGKNWTHWSEGMPNVQIRDMKIHPREGDLVLATFGRAFWVLDDINPLRKMADNGIELIDNDFLAFDTPDAYHVSTRSYEGIRFNAQGDFNGDNRWMGGARLSLWVKPGDMDDKKEKKKKDVLVKVTNESGDTIRTFKRSLDDGLNRIYWGLEEDGIIFPSRRERKPDADLPGGMDVLPGTYKLHFAYNGNMDSTMVEVKMDPRIEWKVSDLEAKRQIMEDYSQIIDQARESWGKINKAKKTLKLIKGVLEVQQDTSKVDMLKHLKELTGDLDSLETLYFNPQGLKGIQRNPNNLSSVLGGVRRYVNSSWGVPGDNAMNTISRARIETEKVTSAVTSFFNEKWTPFQEKVREMKIDLFSVMEEKQE
ncbi:MAG: hypothetical protein HKN68_21155 [Saprospiraceae bacterium]|nr:hypothetical protein [Saprospiraceae bacterium]